MSLNYTKHYRKINNLTAVNSNENTQNDAERKLWDVSKRLVTFGRDIEMKICQKWFVLQICDSHNEMPIFFSRTNYLCDAELILLSTIFMLDERAYIANVRSHVFAICSKSYTRTEYYYIECYRPIH